MHCLVLAGGHSQPDDPLFDLTNGRPKALLDVAGRPMISWVLEALAGAQTVEEIVVVGLGRDEAESAGVPAHLPIRYLPDEGSMLANVMTGAAYIREQWPETTIIMGASADIPAITSDIVDAFHAACAPWDKDIYYNFVTREVMEARFPASTRTYTKLGDLEVAGGDLIMATLTAIDSQQVLYESVTAARKQPWRIAQLVGWRVLLRMLLRRLTLDDVREAAERATGLSVALLLSEHAEIAMDADKPNQVALLRDDLAHHPGSSYAR